MSDRAEALPLRPVKRPAKRNASIRRSGYPLRRRRRQAIPAMIARSVSMPSPVSDEVSTISG